MFGLFKCTYDYHEWVDLVCVAENEDMLFAYCSENMIILSVHELCKEQKDDHYCILPVSVITTANVKKADHRNPIFVMPKDAKFHFKKGFLNSLSVREKALAVCSAMEGCAYWPDSTSSLTAVRNAVMDLEKSLASSNGYIDKIESRKPNEPLTVDFAVQELQVIQAAGYGKALIKSYSSLADQLYPPVNFVLHVNGKVSQGYGHGSNENVTWVEVV